MTLTIFKESGNDETKQTNLYELVHTGCHWSATLPIPKYTCLFITASCWVKAQKHIRDLSRIAWQIIIFYFPIVRI